MFLSKMHVLRITRLAVLIMLCFSVVAEADEDQVDKMGTVYVDAGDAVRIEYGVLDMDNGTAVVKYSEHLFKDGWNKLWIKTGDNADAHVAAFAAGFAEGHVSQKSILAMFINNYDDWFVDQPDVYHATAKRIYKWLQDNWEWMCSEAEKHRGDNDRWKWAYLQIQQLRGIVDGYNKAAAEVGDRALSLGDFLLLNADGDVESLAELLDSKSDLSSKRFRLRKPYHREKRNLRCSSLWKLAPDNSEVFFAHTTWDHFDMMNRMLKTYSFGFRGLDPVVISMSSSPGFLSSVDDFYLTSRGLSVIETTNGNFKKKLWKHVNTSSLLSWVRTNVANSLATSAKAWTEIFSEHNSGTYNDQWMVFDNNKFESGKELLPETFMVLEQLPGLIVSEDKTKHLQDEGFWGSYNIPYYKEIYDQSGFSSQKPTWAYSHDRCPRAKMMKRLHSNVTSIETMKRIIRYNNWQKDPDSRGSPCEAISARCDLAWVYGLEYSIEGGIDAKVSSSTMAKSLSFVAQNGPTYYQQPAFDWKSVGPFPDPVYQKEPVHVGMPEHWEFPWVHFQP